MRTRTCGSPSWPGFLPRDRIRWCRLISPCPTSLADGAGHTFPPSKRRDRRRLASASTAQSPNSPTRITRPQTIEVGERRLLLRTPRGAMRLSPPDGTHMFELVSATGKVERRVLRRSRLRGIPAVGITELGADEDAIEPTRKADRLFHLGVLWRAGKSWSRLRSMCAGGKGGWGFLREQNT